MGWDTLQETVNEIDLNYLKEFPHYLCSNSSCQTLNISKKICKNK